MDDASLAGLMSPSTLRGLLSSDLPPAYERAPDSEPDLEKHYSHADDDSSEDDESTVITSGSRKKNFKILDARTVSDAIIGLSDGLTVPFALTAGLSALGETKIVVFGGLAELIAGAISMGLGGYLGAKSEEESYKATLKETHHLVASDTTTVTSMITDVFAPYDLPPRLITELTDHLLTRSTLPSFLMNFHHTLPELSDSRALTCALTIALGYFIGGFVPLVPYFFVGSNDAFVALRYSIAIMAVALFLFGYAKTCYVNGWRGGKNVRKGSVGGLQMVLVGGVAAGLAMGLVKGAQGLAGSNEEVQ
ncbi:hypothetical protein FQN50_005983 [Emmonsiellopsis sp. PD_5]|nr:hypothetical protein FQN50_005983 [Emmonsiellopsis sp. PD_5]